MCILYIYTYPDQAEARFGLSCRPVSGNLYILTTGHLSRISVTSNVPSGSLSFKGTLSVPLLQVLLLGYIKSLRVGMRKQSHESYT